MLSKEEIVNYLNNIIDKYYEKISEIGEDDYNEDLDDICCDINELIEKIEDGIENDDYYRGYNEKDKLAKEICKKCKYRKQYRELESNNKKLIEKLEEDNKKAKQGFETTLSSYEHGIMNYTQEILEIVKGEKE